MNSGRPGSESLPAELMRYVPRQVELTATGVAALSGAVLLLLSGVVSGAWFYVAAERDAGLRSAAAQESVSTMAEVTRVHRRRGRNAKTEVFYRYSVNGREYTGRTQLRKRDAGALQQGGNILVRYVASAPAQSWLPGHEPQGVQFRIIPLIVLPLCAAGSLIMFRMHRQRQLLTSGRVTFAHVTEARKFQHSQGSGYHVHFEFHLLSGARRTGRFNVHKDPPEVGSPVAILYDPDDPERYERYPLPLVRPRQ